MPRGQCWRSRLIEKSSAIHAGQTGEAFRRSSPAGQEGGHSAQQEEGADRRQDARFGNRPAQAHGQQCGRAGGALPSASTDASIMPCVLLLASLPHSATQRSRHT